VNYVIWRHQNHTRFKPLLRLESIIDRIDDLPKKKGERGSKRLFAKMRGVAEGN